MQRRTNMNSSNLRKIQIEYSFFLDLISYAFMHEDPADPRFRSIYSAFHRKIEAMERHQVYSQYKTGATQEVRSKARDEYLELICLRDSHRWPAEYDANVMHNPDAMFPELED